MTDIRRKSQWRPALAAYIDECRSTPFAWGSHDCALFAAGAVEAMTGADLARGLRGKYRDARSATRVIKKAGFGSLGDLVAARLPEVAPGLADRGDLAIIRDDDGMAALAVVVGAEVVAAREIGVSFVSRARVERAFHVPFGDLPNG